MKDRIEREIDELYEKNLNVKPVAVAFSPTRSNTSLIWCGWG
jgi:hypothetical protein